jgi:hypothetical protein
MQNIISISQPQLVPQQEVIAGLRPALEQLLGSLFGCKHRRLSWPITHGRGTYRVCVRCGMSRNFDPHTWKSFGPFCRPDRDRQ